MPDDRDVDLNGHPEPGWLDEVGRRVRDRLRRTRGAPIVVGHGDWEGQNLRWRGRQPWAVHDWDSVITGTGSDHRRPCRVRLAVRPGAAGRVD